MRLSAPTDAVLPRSSGVEAETSGWGQTNPDLGLAGGGARSRQDLVARQPIASPAVPPSPAARAPHARWWAQLPGLSICLFVVSSSLGAHDQQHPKGVGAEFPSSECVRGILNGKPDQKSSDQPSSDYSPLAPPFLPPPPDLHKKGEENSGWAPAAAHSAPPGRSPPKLRSGFLHEAQRTAPLPRSPPRARRPGAPVAWPPAFQAP